MQPKTTMKNCIKAYKNQEVKPMDIEISIKGVKLDLSFVSENRNNVRMGLTKRTLNILGSDKTKTYSIEIKDEIK